MTCKHGYIGACPNGCDVPQPDDLIRHLTEGAGLNPIIIDENTDFSKLPRLSELLKPKGKSTDWKWFNDCHGGTYYRLNEGTLQAKLDPEDPVSDVVDVDLYHGTSSKELTADCQRIYDELIKG